MYWTRAWGVYTAAIFGSRSLYYLLSLCFKISIPLLVPLLFYSFNAPLSPTLFWYLSSLCLFLFISFSFSLFLSLFHILTFSFSSFSLSLFLSFSFSLLLFLFFSLFLSLSLSLYLSLSLCLPPLSIKHCTGLVWIHQGVVFVLGPHGSVNDCFVVPQGKLIVFPSFPQGKC